MVSSCILSLLSRTSNDKMQDGMLSLFCSDWHSSLPPNQHCRSQLPSTPSWFNSFHYRPHCKTSDYSTETTRSVIKTQESSLCSKSSGHNCLWTTIQEYHQWLQLQTWQFGTYKEYSNWESTQLQDVTLLSRPSNSHIKEQRRSLHHLRNGWLCLQSTHSSLLSHSILCPHQNWSPLPWQATQHLSAMTWRTQELRRTQSGRQR